MPVHPEIKKVLDFIPAYDPTQRVDVKQHRAQFDAPALPKEQRAQVAQVETRMIHTEEAAFNVRMYTPHEATQYGLLFFFHGGAFMSGNLESHDDVARELCVASGYKVIAVDYRLAPEHPYPAPLFDCYHAVKWAVDARDELRWDGENLALAGDSSGGNLVAAVTLLSRQKKDFSISKQVLLYPSLDLDFSEFRYPSLTENGQGYFVESAQLAELNGFYLEGGADVHNPLVSPLRETNYEGLPEALVVTAEYDPFRDEGELYAQRLKQAGVPTVMKRYDGVTHGFLGKWTHLDEYKDAYLFIGEFLKAK